MTVLFVSSVSDLTGGAEHSLLELARGLDGRGVRVALACWREGELTRAFRTLGPTSVLGAGDPASPLGGATAGVPLVRPVVRAANWIRLHLRPVDREARWLAGVIREADADVIHTNCDLSPPAAARAARDAGVPWVAHVRDMTRSWLHRRNASALRSADAVIGPSRFLTARLMEAGVSAQVIPNPLADGQLQRPIDAPERARTRRDLGLDDDEFAVAVVGRLDAQKGTLHVVEAAGLLGDRGGDGGDAGIRFVVAGAGNVPFEARLRRAMAEAGVAGRILLLGHRDDVATWLPALDAVAVPSTAEGFGRVIVEGMAAGLPVVAFRDGAAPELIDHDRTGVLVPAGDVSALADALRALAADPVRARRLGAAAREATGRYDPDAVAEQVERLYHRTLED